MKFLPIVICIEKGPIYFALHCISLVSPVNLIIDKLPPKIFTKEYQKDTLPPPNKLSFRPLGSGGILQIVSRPREEEYLGELVTGIREVVKDRLVSG